VLDTKPLTLDASDVDALAAFGRQVGQEIDRIYTESTELSILSDPTTEDVQALQQMASTDPLTGLANRRGGEKSIANEISRAKRERRPLSCILIDIDRFKQVNDTYGHEAGDHVLRDLSALLRSTVRAYDILVRWGGEEFLLVLPGVDLEAARILADRIRRAAEALEPRGVGPLTISAGVAGFDSDYDFATTLRTADRRLYQAKSSGRNRVV
jgi:diguanylate cyclase (GGDEF)-like protein